MSTSLRIESRKKKQAEEQGPQPGWGGKRRLRAIDEIVEEAVTGKKRKKG